ncbi:hypothetical protein [Streptomyces sp. NPDC004270]
MTGTKFDWKRRGAEALLFALSVLLAYTLASAIASAGTARNVWFLVFIPVIGFPVHKAGEAVGRLITGSRPNGGPTGGDDR